MIKPADKNSLAHYVLEVRSSEAAATLTVERGTPMTFDGIGLFFCPAAGAEAPFAVGRVTLATGAVNQITYEYYETLGEAEYVYRHRIY